MVDRDQHPTRENEIRRAVFGQVDLQTAELEIDSSIYDGFAAAIMVKGQPRTIALTREYGDAVQLMALIERGRSAQPEASEAGAAAGEGPQPVRGEIRVIDGNRCRFIERELEGDKWEVIGPALSDTAPAPGGAVETVWRCAMTVACNIAIDEQNRTNDDDGPSEVLNAQGEIIRRLKGVLEIDRNYRSEVEAILRHGAEPFITAPSSGEGFSFADRAHDAAVALRAVLDAPDDATRRPHARYYLERLEEALRAQPPAREDALPVAWRFRDHPNSGWVYTSLGGRHDGCEVQPLYTHPAPDALREAVEALKHYRCSCEAGHCAMSADDDDTPIDEQMCGRRASKALAALQAEQGAK
ncbi:hypothetical protein ABE453_02180 [Brevundimonas diminuta]|uniref:hypothetical protein n=1 Tax=Brevundimonas diminuta TaxID=293 RepID=UPI00320B999E